MDLTTDSAVETGKSELIGRSCKVFLDLVLSTLLIVVLSPFLALIAGLVLWTSGRPVLYRRRVVGLHGVEFDAFKFRTMVNDADAMLASHPELRRRFDANMKLRDDPRLTPLGGFLRRTSLDELPQLFNVLRGEMSLVGPRMISPDETGKYAAFLPRRLAFKPGMTGLWQVSGRQELGYEDRVRHDLHYLENWSLWLDLSILARTIPAVLSMRGAF